MALLGTPTIAHHYQLCVETFRLLCNALEYAQPRFLEQLAPPKLHAELGRLRVWAGNLGAHHVGRSSLDHRLRQAGHMRQRAIGLLDDLRGNLRDGQPSSS